MTEIEESNPYDVLYNILHDILIAIKDINKVRANQSTTEEQNWWFPDYPNANDENYPRGSIEMSTVEFIPFGADEFVQDVESGGVLEKTQKGHYVNIPVTIHIHIKKDQLHEVENIGGALTKMKDKRLGDYMSYIVTNKIRQTRTTFIDSGFDFNSNINVTPTYEDNTFLYSADVAFDLICVNIWNIDYTSDELIATIEDDIEVERE